MPLPALPIDLLGKSEEGNWGNVLYGCWNECLGTFFFAFAHFAMVSAGTTSEWSVNTAVVEGFGHGVIVMLLIYVYGDRSGAHLNPLHSFTNGFAGNISIPRMIGYVASQIVGGMGGAGAFHRIIGASAARESGFGRCAIGDLDADRAFLNEFMFDSLWVAIAFGVLMGKDRRPLYGQKLSVFLFATTLAFNIIYSLTSVSGFGGAEMNPVFCFASSVYVGHWNHQGVFWGAAFLAAIVNAIFQYIHLVGDTAARRVEDERKEAGHPDHNLETNLMDAAA